MDREHILRRVKACRALAGFDSVENLADAIGSRGMSAGTLAQRESAAGPDYTIPELRAIANACGLPFEFFVADLDRLPEITEPAQLRALQLAQAAAEQARRQRERSQRETADLREAGQES